MNVALDWFEIYQFFQRCDDVVCFGKVCFRVAVGDGNNLQACGLGGLDAGRGVLDGDGLSGSNISIGVAGK